MTQEDEEVDAGDELARLYYAEAVLELSRHRTWAEILYYTGNEAGSWLELLHWAAGCEEFGKRHRITIKVFT